MTAPENQRRSSPRSQTAFVGREREMAELVSALDDAESGSGSMAMLVGDPGIGKTRTAEELADHAQAQGHLVLWGRCHEQQGMPPFWPWVQAIRTYVRDCKPEVLRSDMGNGASVIADVVSDLNQILPDLASFPLLDSPEQARFRLFDAITTFLRNTSSRFGSLVLILEDLHWSDRPSLLLLEFLSQELSDSHLMVVGTYRDIDLSRQHPLAESLGQLARSRFFRRIALRGLSVEDEGQLIQVSSGEEPNREFVEMIHSRTEGNPLFVGEVVRMLEQENDALATGSDVRIPEGVREVIGRRLNRLTELCNQVLTVASVVGREFEFSQLARLIESMSDDELLDALEAAVSAKIIEELPSGAGRYQFTHALIQQTLIEELSTTRRVRLHAQIMFAFEDLYGDEVEDRSAELAYHAAEAELVVGAEKLVHYSLMAGEQALAAYAWDEARAHFETGLSSKERQPMDDEKADLLFGLAKAQRYGPEGTQTMQPVETVIPAFNYYIESGNTSKAVDVARYPFHFRFGYNVGVEFARTAASLVQEGSVEQGFFLSRYGENLYTQTGDFDAAMDSLKRAMGIAIEEKNAALEFRVLNDLAHVYESKMLFRESLETALKAIELSSRVDTRVRDQFPAVAATNASVALGDLDSATYYANALLDDLDPYISTANQAYFYFLNHLIARLEGSWEVARSYSDQGLKVSPRDARLLYSRTIVEYQVGNFPTGDRYLERLLDVMRSLPPGPTLVHILSLAAIALTSLIRSDKKRLELIDPIMEMVSVPRAVGAVFWFSRWVLGIKALQYGDIDGMVREYDTLNTYPNPMHGWGNINNSRLLGLLSRGSGDMANSESHFEEAVAFCRKAGYRPELAWSLHDYADMLVQRNDPGGFSRAAELLNEADQIASDLGMAPLGEKVADLRAQLDARPVPGPEHPDGLTEREVEVLRLLASGRTNQDIADELYIALNTVARHVSNIYTKTDSANRAEATLYATRQGLV